jgi:hypothetical protein
VLATITLRKASEAPEIARLILDGYPAHRVFAFHGDLLARKGALIHAFSRWWGAADGARSSKAHRMTRTYARAGVYTLSALAWGQKESGLPEQTAHFPHLLQGLLGTLRPAAGTGQCAGIRPGSNLRQAVAC